MKICNISKITSFLKGGNGKNQLHSTIAKDLISDNKNSNEFSFLQRLKLFLDGFFI